MKSSWLVLAPALFLAPGLARAQQPEPPPSSLESGGLRPPDAVDPTLPDPNQPAEQTPEKELAEADKEDAGRGLEWVWLNAEIGGEHLGLHTIKADDLFDGTLAKTTQTGLVFGAGCKIDESQLAVYVRDAAPRIFAVDECDAIAFRGPRRMRVIAGR